MSRYEIYHFAAHDQAARFVEKLDEDRDIISMWADDAWTYVLVDRKPFRTAWIFNGLAKFLRRERAD